MGLLQSFRQEQNILAFGKFSLPFEKEGRSASGMGAAAGLTWGRQEGVLSGWKAEVNISPNDADWGEKQQLQGSSHPPKAPPEHPRSRGTCRVMKLPGGAGSQAELQEARA